MLAEMILVNIRELHRCHKAFHLLLLYFNDYCIQPCQLWLTHQVSEMHFGLRHMIQLHNMVITDSGNDSMKMTICDVNLVFNIVDKKY